MELHWERLLETTHALHAAGADVILSNAQAARHAVWLITADPS